MPGVREGGSVKGFLVVAVTVCCLCVSCAAPANYQQCTGDLGIEFSNQTGQRVWVIPVIPTLRTQGPGGFMQLFPDSTVRVRYYGVTLEQPASVFLSGSDMHGNPPVEVALGMADRDILSPHWQRWVLRLDERGLPTCQYERDLPDETPR